MNFTEFHFLRPNWLFALLPYVLIVILILRHKLSRGNWNQVCDTALLPYILEQRPSKQNRWPIVATTIAALLCIIALAGPVWERIPAPVFRNTSALIIILDLSRSMDATDIKPSRLVRARYKIADILRQRKDGQTALIVYAADAFTVTPLTDDTATINSQLAALTTQIMPAQGSNTVSALQQAIQLFKQAGLQKGQILLVTDGVSLDDTISTAYALDHYNLSVLGVGTATGAPIKLPAGGFLKDSSGSIVLPRLLTNELQQLAAAGGGRFQALTADNQDIESLISDFTETHERQKEQENDLMLDLWQERGPWLLFLVLPIAAALFRRGIFCLALMMLPIPETAYAFTWQDLWKTPNQQAQQAFQQQQFEQAADTFTDPAWKAAAQYKSGQYDKVVDSLQGHDSSDSYYNRGNALAKAGKLQEAIAAYEQSLKRDPDNADAKYNKEVVEQALQKQEQQQQNSDQNADKKNQSQQQQNNGDKQPDQAQGQQSEQQQSANQDNETDNNNQQQPSDEQQQQQQEEEQQAALEPKQKTSDHQAEQQEMQQAEENDNVEMQQANEQWLKRIPDDPAGLLRRKFKYQYGKRSQQPSGKHQW